MKMFSLGPDHAKKRYKKALEAHAKAQTAEEENTLFDEVIAATDAYREQSLAVNADHDSTLSKPTQK